MKKIVLIGTSWSFLYHCQLFLVDWISVDFLSINDFMEHLLYRSYFGPHFLCWISGVVPFNTWLISCWEKNKCCYKLSKCKKWHLFHSKRSKLSFWVKIVVILSVAQLVTTVIFFSTWDKSRIKWDNSWNSTQKMRTLVYYRLESPHGQDYEVDQFVTY